MYLLGKSPLQQAQLVERVDRVGVVARGEVVVKHLPEGSQITALFHVEPLAQGLPQSRLPRLCEAERLLQQDGGGYLACQQAGVADLCQRIEVLFGGQPMVDPWHRLVSHSPHPLVSEPCVECAEDLHDPFRRRLGVCQQSPVGQSLVGVERVADAVGGQQGIDVPFA